MYPTLNPAEEQTPVAIEYAYFLDDGEQDQSKPNRYYFNFPQEWCTANRGESIVGVRNIWMIAHRRKLEFDFSIRKYLRKDFDELKAKEEYKDFTNDQIYDELPEKSKIEVSSHIISWFSTDNDMRKLFDDIHEQMKKKFEKYNEQVLKKYGTTLDKLREIYSEYTKIKQQYINKAFGNYEIVNNIITFLFNTPEIYKSYTAAITNWLNNYKDKIVPLFHQEDIDRALNDIQMDGYYDYDKKAFVETLFSPQNLELVKPIILHPPEYIAPGIDDDFLTTPTPPPTALPTPEPTPEVNEYIDLGVCYVDFKINFAQKMDSDTNYVRSDFINVMNIGNKSYQNNPDDYQNKWLRRLDFKNVWDRHSCKVYSSIAEQSNKYYLGNSQIYFNPIKYFKLNSTDQKFWVELYSGRHNNIPVILPDGESFVIEMQFLPYRKMLYI